MIVFQSSATALWPCPSGTFENSRQHARVIYGWVHGPQPTRSPAGTTEIIIGFSGLKCRSEFIGVHPWLKTNFCNTPFKVSQGYSRLSKPIQGFLGKKDGIMHLTNHNSSAMLDMRTGNNFYPLIAVRYDAKGKNERQSIAQ